MIPHCIVGDFDSIRSEVQDYNTQKNVKMIMKQDQDTTDLEKCLYVSLEKISEISVETDSENYNYNNNYNINKYTNLLSNSIDIENVNKNLKKFSIIILGASGGRIDHTFSAYSQVFKYLNMYSYEFNETEILMISKSSCSVYLKHGRNIIYLSKDWEKKNQGFSIIPLFGEGKLIIYEDEEIEKNKSGIIKPLYRFKLKFNIYHVLNYIFSWKKIFFMLFTLFYLIIS